MDRARPAATARDFAPRDDVLDRLLDTATRQAKLNLDGSDQPWFADQASESEFQAKRRSKLELAQLREELSASRLRLALTRLGSVWVIARSVLIAVATTCVVVLMAVVTVWAIQQMLRADSPRGLAVGTVLLTALLATSTAVGVRLLSSRRPRRVNTRQAEDGDRREA